MYNVSAEIDFLCGAEWLLHAVGHHELKKTTAEYSERLRERAVCNFLETVLGLDICWDRALSSDNLYIFY